MNYKLQIANYKLRMNRLVSVIASRQALCHSLKRAVRRGASVSVAISLLFIVSAPAFSAMEGEIEVGAQGTRKDRYSTKMEEYRTVPEGVFVEKLVVNTEHEKSNCYLNIKGSKLGLDDQSFSLKGGKLGLMKLGLKYDQTPHFYGIGKTFYVDNGNGELGLPDKIQLDLISNVMASSITLNAAPAFELKTRRDTISADINVTPLEGLSVRLIGSSEDRNGYKENSFYSPMTEVPEPIKYHTNDIGINIEHKNSLFNALFGYKASIFHNDIDELIIDNPVRLTDATPSSSGSSTPGKFGLALPPDNQAHNFTLAGGAKLPFWNSRLNASFSYGWMTQNDQFVPITVNQQIMAKAQTLTYLNPPRQSLEGKVKTLNINSSLILKPINPLTVVANVKYYDRDDRTDEMPFVRVSRDSSYSTSTPLMGFRETSFRESHPIGYSKLNLGSDVTYNMLSSLSLNLGWEWEKIKRHKRDLDQSNEHMYKASLNYTPANWINLRPNYLHGHRSIHHYSIEEVVEVTFPLGEGETTMGQSEELRKFDQANRLRDIVGIKTSVYPLDSLTIDAEYGFRYDNYMNSELGTQNEKNHAIAFDLAYDPSDRLSLFWNYGWEENTLNMKNRVRQAQTATRLALDTPANDWDGRSVDKTETYGAGANVAVVKDKVDFDVSYNLMLSQGDIFAWNPNIIDPDTTKGTAGQTTAQKIAAIASAYSFPQTKTEEHKFVADLKWHLMENLIAKLGYEYERYMYTDYAVDGIKAWQNYVGNGTTDFSQYMFMASQPLNYDVHIFGLSLVYKF